MKMVKAARCILFGAAIWAVATLGFRLAGEVFFRPDIALVVGLLAIGAIPAIAGLTLAGFRLFRVEVGSRAAAAAIFAATGMVLDAVAIFCWPSVYPNLEPRLAAPFGAYMLWCNAIALVTGVVAQSVGFNDPNQEHASAGRNV